MSALMVLKTEEDTIKLLLQRTRICVTRIIQYLGCEINAIYYKWTKQIRSLQDMQPNFKNFWY